MKKFLSIVLAILMVVTMIPMAAYAATSGSCGDGVYFTINNGTLTITGSGEVMAQAASTCWSKERPDIKKIVIGSGITLPNSFAFYGHGDLTTVEYGNTVATITGTGAFGTCINITSFTLREGVGMSSNAFNGARKLTGANVKLVDASGNDKSSFYTVTVESNTSNSNYMTVKGNLAKGYIADIPAQDHTGEEVKPAVKVIWNGQTVSSSNYDVTYSNNIELGTATVTVKGKDANYYTGTLTQTFEIKPHVHDWSNKDGICAGGCGLECAHESFTDGVCTTCGYVCVHNNIVDSKCLVCGLTGKFIAINMYDYYGDGWLGNEIIISKLLADGSSEAIDTATLEDGEEGTYRLIVGTDDIFTLTWNANNYSRDCTFTVDVDGKNVFESKSCDNYEDGEVVYTYCKHTFENGVCTACDHVCLHKNVADDSCLDCYLSLKNVTINMHDGYGDGWDGAHIIISKLLADGSFREIGLATLENIGNGVYDFPIAESDIYSLKWQSGTEDYFYAFEVLVDGETVFESKTCDNYKDGEIVYINCEHTFENGTCTVCGIPCTHTNISGNKCLICGLTGKIVTINMFDSYGDGWNGSNVIISKLLDDGSSAEIGTATLEDGEEEGTYNLIIDENDVFTLKWDKGSYDGECTFEVLIDGETVFDSESCDNYEAGEIVYINCEHTFENGVCTACGHVCRHKNVADDSCLDCYSSLKNVTINMHDGYGDGWDGANVIISKLLDNGSSAEIGTATLSFGEVKGTYTFLIAENSGFTLKWEKGSYDSECTFEVLIDGETVFESESCDNYEDGEVVYTYCEHSFENDVCVLCGHICAHENETGDTCSVCGASLHTCDFSGEWKYDADKHWKECTADDCDKISEEAEHTYTDGICECGYECPHEWDEGVLTRPIRITTTDWDDGYYTYTCSACGYYYNETVKRADYTALDAIVEDFIDAMYDTTLLDSIRNELKVIYYDNIKVLYGDYIESEQAEVDALVETMTQKLAEVESGVADGSALKPDYTEGDALINGIIEQFYDKGIAYVDEIIAEFDTLYNEYLAIWHKPETTKPQVDEIVEELKALKEKIDKGTEDGTLIKADYTSIDNDIYELEYKLENKMITDEGKSGFEEIKEQLNEMKADENTSKADLAELEKALDEYEAEIDKGIEDGTLVKFDGEKVFSDYESEVGEALIEKYGADNFHNFINKVLGEKFYTEYDNIYSDACALTGGTMAENAENIAQIKALVDGLYGKVVNCLAGTHNYGEGVLTRPTFETEGYYTYTCTLCGHSYTESVKRADSTALNDASMKVTEYIDNDTLTQEARDGIYKSYRDILKNNGNLFDEFGFVRGDLIEEDQPAIDAITAELEKIIADADEKIASGEYVKIDGIKEYNKIADALDAEILENYSQEEFAALAEKAGDEINARLGEIIEKAEALTGSVAENKDALAEIESELSALYAEVKNCLDGVHNGLVYEITEKAKCGKNAVESATCTLCGETDEREVEGTALEHSFTKYEVTEEAECGKAGKEIAYCDHGCGATDEKEIAALEHIFLDYVSNGDATCTADGTKTAFCIHGCGATDTVADEGSMIDHSDEDGDKLCDDCGEEVYDRCDICGGKAHGDDKIQLVFCMIITLIRFVTLILKSIN